jgi:hypothetical protein
MMRLRERGLQAKIKGKGKLCKVHALDLARQVRFWSYLIVALSSTSIFSVYRDYV